MILLSYIWGGCKTWSFGRYVVHTVESFNSTVLNVNSQQDVTFQRCCNNIPSGELTFCHGKSPFLMGKSTISMAIFNCYVSSPEGILFCWYMFMNSSTIVSWVDNWPAGQNSHFCCFNPHEGSNIPDCCPSFLVTFCGNQDHQT